MKVLCAFLALPLAASQAQQIGSESRPSERPVDGLVLGNSKNSEKAETTTRPQTNLRQKAVAMPEDQLTVVPGLRSLNDLDRIEFKEQELLLRFKPELSVQRQGEFLADIEVEEVTFRSRLVPGLIAVRVKTTVRETLAKAGNRSDVLKYISPNGKVRAFSSSAGDAVPVNDPKMDLLWGFEPDRPGTNGVYPAWNYEIGSEEIMIGVLDTSLGMTIRPDGSEGVHPDLMANMWVNEDEIPWNGIDDDENGYIDDLNGYNFSWFGTADTTDTNVHGAHVAGTIAAVGNNGVGVSGVMQRARLVNGMVFPAGGGFTLDGWVVEGMEYCALAGCKVLNLSLGGFSPSGETEPFYDDMIEAALDLGVITVVAAGNELMDAAYTTPANSPLAVTVGGMSPNGEYYGSMNPMQRGGTNWGDIVDVCAPAYNIWSTLDQKQAYGVYGYLALTGTSMSTPYVSGVLGLGFSAIHHGKTELGDLSPRAQAEALIDALIETGTDPDVDLEIGTLVDPAAFLRRIIRGCTADLDGDGQVNGSDLAELFSNWGTNSSSSDIDGDGIVGPEDLAMILGSWSTCNSSVCGDGICGPGESESCKLDCADPETSAACPVGMIEDCTGLICVPESYIGDGNCDLWMLSVRPPWTPNICCFENDGGDCSETQCQLPCSDGQLLDCAGNCVPSSLIADGYCDEPSTTGYDLNCEQTNYDGWDCQNSELGYCGNGICEVNESTWCPDCAAFGECPDGYVTDCSGSGVCHMETWIGDGYCDTPAVGWDVNLCCFDLDGGDCSDAQCAECGDGTCSTGETEDTCPEDCYCGDGICGTGETSDTCPEDCEEGECQIGLVADCDGSGECWEEAWIGDGYCDGTAQLYDADLCCYDGGIPGAFDGGDCSEEECATSVCGDGVCSVDEDANICPADCFCGDGVCSESENFDTCPEDCEENACPQGEVADCDGSGECWVASWIGDGYCDGVEQQYGADLCCYELDGGDCSEAECDGSGE